MSAGNLGTFKPDLSDVIRTTVDSMLLDMYFCLPAKIVSYDKATQYATVQVQLYSARMDGTLIKYPPIPMVPVKHPRAQGGKAFIHMPLAPNDDVTLVFSQRSLDNWKTQGGMSDPQDPRKSHITDAFALIGGSAIPDAFSPSTADAIEIQNGQSQLQIFPNGKFKVTNGQNELIDLMDQLLDVMINKTFTLTFFGPEPFIQSTNLLLQQIKDKLDTLKV